MFEGEVTWRKMFDRTLAWARLVTLSNTSGRYVGGNFLSPASLFMGALYLSPLVGSSSLSWPFALT
jgi:hypothetical protein